LRDYLYISLGGNRQGRVRTKINLLLTMVLGGLWHGAAWHFVLWGVYHGLGLALAQAWREWRKPPATSPGRARKFAAWSATMAFVFYGWLLFRAQSMDQILALSENLTSPHLPPYAGSYLASLLITLLPLIALDGWQIRSGQRLIVLAQPGWIKGLLQGLIWMSVIYHWNQANSPFIYFQF
jgi:hypothetical protein